MNHWGCAYHRLMHMMSFLLLQLVHTTLVAPVTRNDRDLERCRVYCDGVSAEDVWCHREVFPGIFGAHWT